MVIFDGLLCGWGMVLVVFVCVILFVDFCVLGLFKLVQILVECICEWLLGYDIMFECQYIIEVLLDEICIVLCQCMYLLMLNDWWLLKIVLQLLVDLFDECSLVEWVYWVGLLLCSLICYFCDEIMFSFVQWWQQVWFFEVLCQLIDGCSVVDIVYVLGFSSVSVFVIVFCCYFGLLLGCYLVWVGYGLEIGLDFVCGLVFFVVFG